MKVKVVKFWRDHETRVSQGDQTFTIHEGPKEECRWYAKMFRVALKNHDAELFAKQPRSGRYFPKGIGGS